MKFGVCLTHYGREVQSAEPVGAYAGRAGNTPFNGAPSLIRERIAEFEEAGVEHIVLDMATLSRASFLRTLEAFAAHVRS